MKDKVQVGDDSKHKEVKEQVKHFKGQNMKQEFEDSLKLMLKDDVITKRDYVSKVGGGSFVPFRT